MTSKFSVLTLSIYRSAILRRPVVLLCNLPHPATSSSPGASPSLSLFLPFANSLLINSMHPGSRSFAILRGIVNNIQLKHGIDCSLLLCSGYSQSFTPCLRTCSYHPTPDDIMNVIKCGVYSREATILLRFWSGAASIQGWPLHMVRRLFEQIQYYLV